jgi:hypothetical protein
MKSIAADLQQLAFCALKEKPQLLWSNVAKAGPNDCWNWTASVNKDGYGSVRVGPSSILAHRAAFALTADKMPKGLCVCHQCDSPSCCNPSHMFASDHAGNMADMREKGRRKGAGLRESNGRAKLTEKTALEIREKRSAGASLKELAEHYSVGKTTVSRVARMESWA